MSSAIVVTVWEVVVSVTVASPADASVVSVLVGSFMTEHIGTCEIDATFLNT